MPISFYFWAMFVLPVGFGCLLLSPYIISVEQAKNVPFQKTTVIVTSKDSQQVLSFKSDKLPKKGDRITADKYTYGAASVGDTICVQYKSIPNDSQFGIEFVNEGVCK